MRQIGWSEFLSGLGPGVTDTFTIDPRGLIFESPEFEEVYRAFSDYSLHQSFVSALASGIFAEQIDLLRTISMGASPVLQGRTIDLPSFGYTDPDQFLNF